MRIFWAVVVGVMVFWAGRLGTNILTMDWLIASWQAAAIPPGNGSYLPTYDGQAMLRIMAIKYSFLAVWSFVAGAVSGSMAPHRAYRCAAILAIFFVAEFAGMRWWVSYRARPAYVGTELADYLTAIPDFIIALLFLFLGAAVARGLRRKNLIPTG